jgi:hypothetical protein
MPVMARSILSGATSFVAQLKDATMQFPACGNRDCLAQHLYPRRAVRFDE